MISLLAGSGVRSGLLAGCIALTCAVAIATISTRARWLQPLPLSGIAISLAASAVLVRAEPAMPVEVQQMFVYALVAGCFATYFKFGIAGTALAYLPAALLLGTIENFEGAPSWVPLACAATLCVGGSLCADFERHNRPAGLAPLAFVIAVFGVASTLPDTEHIAVLLGASLPLAAIYLFPSARAVGSIGWAGLVGLLAATIWIDGRGRPGAIVGAIGALGLLVVEPVVRHLTTVIIGREQQRQHHNEKVVGALVICTHGAVAFSAGRVAGLREDATSAAVLVAGIWLVGAVACIALPRVAMKLSPERLPSRSSHRVSRGDKRL